MPIIYNMYKRVTLRKVILVSFVLAPFALAGCATQISSINSGGKKSADYSKSTKYSYSKQQLAERNCLIRAMYFESNRSSREGMISVGTVVMNRVNSSAYPNTICGVVGQKNQFAPGVLSKSMNEGASLRLASEAADAVLHGERSKNSKNAMFFHTAGLKFPYKNMHYVEVAGGNAFYEKRSRNGQLQVPVNDAPYSMATAFAEVKPNNAGSSPVMNTMPSNQADVSPIFALITKDAEQSITEKTTQQTIYNTPVPQQSPKLKNVTIASAEENDPFKNVVLNYSMPSPKKIAEIGERLHKQKRDGL